MSLNELTISEALTKLHAKEIKASELTGACLAAIEAGNKALNAFLAVTADKAMDAAKESDKRLAAKSKSGVRALEGIPLGVKDLFCTKGVRTTAGSHVLGSFTPPYESTVTQNLWDAGAIMLGKLNMDEFAMGSSNETSYFGPCINPWRAANSVEKLVPGGSSGGSAAAVAAGLCLGATASDTGGSIRQPAAFTGTVGIKPTYGRCSRWGMVAFASSLDQAGPIARSVKDAALLLQAMVSHDPKDSTSIAKPMPDLEKALGQPVKGLRIGIPREYRVDGMAAEIGALWEKGIEIFKQAGAKIVDVSLPHTKAALPAYYIVAPAEASSNLARYDGVRYGLRANGKDITAMYEETRAEGFGAEVKRRILIGTYVLSAGYYDAYYLKAQKIRSLIKRDFDEAFKAVDVMLTPATPTAAFPLGSKGGSDPVAMYLNDIFTVTVNMAGLPGLVVPGGRSADGLPLGLQIIGKPFDEGLVLRAGQLIEDAVGRMPIPEPWWRNDAAAGAKDSGVRAAKAPQAKKAAPKQKGAGTGKEAKAGKPAAKSKSGKKLNGAS
jgi:aspartyl-tRNA(Asn)/glutamyl-tRNA(Gln) amidotransferase subunit A